MRQSLSSSLRVVEHENQYPDCIWLGLDVDSASSLESDQIELFLTMRWGEQRQSIEDGSVQFGLTGSELQIHLVNAAWVETSTHLASDTAVIERISHHHDANHATWRFQTPPTSILRGELTRITLATIRPTASSCRLEAMLAIAPVDIRLTEAEGLWRHDITPNQHAVLERVFARQLHQTTVHPFPSWMQLCYECPSPCPKIADRVSQVMNGASAETLESLVRPLVHHVMDAQTQDLLELASRVGLTPSQDFAGGNLLGVTLIGAELSEANLERVNLRGADLSDAELSEANLNDAVLSGADLSGADLGSATLQAANLHRASLALANLGGAHLQAANLLEANLTNTNLNGVKVEQARFGRNPGMTDALKASLQQRGAIFED
ncbi:MAG: pentapeptide repeat-containing protein [Elainellaceae cyanobacterium]